MAPQIVSRPIWGAHAPTGPLTPWPAGQPTGTTVHYEGAGGHADHSLCAAEVLSIQNFHQHSGYVDIAYNWLVCQHGVIYEGRPAFRFESAAQRAGNPLHVAICYIGGPLTPFTDAGKAAINGVILQGHPVIGHRDEPSCSTFCPDDTIEAWIHAGHPGAGPVPAPVPAPPRLPLPPEGIHHPVLYIGRRGPAVLELQEHLNTVSHSGLVTDGDFGPRTKGAVENFQRYFHLGVDGIAGPKTWGMLDYCYALKH
jgi:hypothetical protein